MHLVVDIQNIIEDENVPKTADVEGWVAEALAQGGYTQESGELTIRVVGLEESQQLNDTYRGKNKPTNVLSFPFEAPPGIPCDLLGDLVICHAIVEAEAKAQSKNTIAHWAHMVIHGTLHLLGYDHLEPAEAEKMESIEVNILAKFKIANPYELP
ncbi:rRNA maturation RNase YbeY [Aliikangiella marina]|uniref:Endoribonuclease YbeY n=1 Tax=Aliikangiella marina TaxID=1712262 RepID=A0A545TC71_9GAMM|nr:rRNA maturation RNase YbeY [Aliikangiella marina]TQV74809.1 rRNA maturation RNase YbeY [Aliikangiella marina]